MTKKSILFTIGLYALILAGVYAYFAWTAEHTLPWNDVVTLSFSLSLIYWPSVYLFASRETESSH